MADRTSEVVLKYKVDKASERAVESSLTDAERRFEDLIDRVDRARRDAAGARAAEDTKAQIDAARNAPPSRGGRRISGGQLVNLGTRALSTVGLGEAGQAVNVIDDLVGQFGKFGVAGAAAAGILGGVTIGLKLLNQQLEGSKQSLNAALGAQQTYYKALEESTSEQVRQQIARLQRSRAIIQIQLDETQNAIDSSFAQLSAMIGDAPARALDQAGQTPYEDLKKRLDELRLSAEESDHAIVRLNQGLESNAFAINDAAARLEQYNKLLLDSAQQQAQKAADEVRFNDQIARASRDDLRELLRQREVERDAIQAQIDTFRTWAPETDEARAQLEKYYDALNTTNQAVQALTDELNKAARARDTWDAVKNFFSGAVDTVTDIGKRIEAAGNINRRIAEIRGKGFEDIAKVELDLQSRILDIQQGTADRRAEILRDAQQDEIERVRDYNRERARIERDANRALLTAVANRDVLSFIEAQRNRDDALSDLNENLQEERRRKNEAAAQQLRDLDRNQQRQIDRLRVSAQQQIGLINQRVQQDVRAQQVLLAQTLGFTQARVNVEVQGYQTILSVATSAIGQIARAWATLGAGAGSTGSNTGTGTAGRAVRTAYSSTEEYLRAARTALVTGSSYPGGR